MFDLPFELPSGWEVKTVGQLIKDKVIEKPLDGNHGGIHPKATDYVDMGVPFVMASDLEAGRVNFNSCKFITEKQASTLRKGFSKVGDVLISHKATIGRTAIVQENEHNFIMLTPQITYYRVKDYLRLNNVYLKSYFDSSFFQTILGLWAGAGSTRAYLGITGQLKLPVIIPPIDKQVSIANHISAINNKIQLNRQTNQTLEHIAQAIFKSWFVDFEPTRAKVKARARINAGKYPDSDETLPPNFTQADEEQLVERAAMAAISGKSLKELEQLSPEQKQKLKTTAALFPESMVDSELGEIPKGWDIKSLDEIAHYQNGLALQKFRPENESDFLPVLKISQLKKGFADGEEKASPNIKPECIVYDGDVVFSWSGSLVVDVWCAGKVALNQHLFKVSSEEYPKWFYYYWTKHHLEVFQQIAADKAVTMGHIKRSHLSEAKCIVPSFDLSRIELISDLLEKQIQLRLEITELQVIRDTMLPKLLSGEIEIGSTE